VKRNLLIGAMFIAALGLLVVTERVLEQSAEAQAKSGMQVPRFEVDPFWPKNMSQKWVFGQTIGLGIDEKDNVWIIHRGNDPGNLDGTEFAHPSANAKEYYKPGSPVSECCDPAPPVVAFDQAGNVAYSWGGPGLHPDWPDSNHGIIVDNKGVVWIGGNGGPDSHIMRFTREGKFVGMFGKKGARMVDGKPVRNADDMESFGRVAKIFLDPKANEAYVADGYFNKRVAVIDMESGKVKRYWGGYGEKPDNADPGRYNPKEGPSRQFRTPVHCAELSTDGFVYVCDRPNDRIQVFTKDGKFVKEAFFAKNSLSEGSVWDVAFSRDQAQTYIFLADGRNMKVRILRRDTLEELTAFGDGGRQPGQFYAVHSVATDSKGNLYTTETYEGKRVQKFVYKGLGPVRSQTQGILWPRSTN
jgi:DNA-binding beta-propeller fold protein YncE